MKVEGKGKRPRKGLDKKDLSIIDALGKLGGKVSTEELADITNIAARTIRYRLKRLRDEGFLSRLYAQTHEYKIGMGDSMLILQEVQGKSDRLKEAIDSIGWFYYTGPTYGRYNGYMIHAMYSLDKPDGVVRLAKEMQSLGIIDDYYYYSVTDYETRRGDFKQFEYNRGWKWDSNQWIREAEGCIATGDAIDIKLEYEPKQMEFDRIDVILINELKAESNRTLKEFGELVNLSETQIKRRITRLEDAGVVKGYRWIIEKIDSPLYIYIFLELSDNVDCILSSFYRLPFPCEILMESRNKYCARIRLYGAEITGLLRGISYMRKYIESYFVQITHDLSEVPTSESSGYFNMDEMRWEYPTDDAIARLRKNFG
ncbi:MAG: winged helix-turn-helix transcriptional regulator [Candidatus Thorarchaeota archaeon]